MAIFKCLWGMCGLKVSFAWLIFDKRGFLKRYVLSRINPVAKAGEFFEKGMHSIVILKSKNNLMFVKL